MAHLAALTGLATAAALMSGTFAAEASIGAEASFACVTQVGVERVRLHVTGDAPAKGRVGRTVRAGEVSVVIDAPTGLITEDASGGEPSGEDRPAYAGADLIDVAARLYVTASQNGQAVGAGWPSFAASGASADRDGGRVTLRGRLSVPPILPVAGGEIVWAANGLALTMTRAGDSPATVTCLPEKPTTLGHVAVAGAPGATVAPPGSTPAADDPGSGTDQYCYPIDPPPEGEDGLNPDPGLSMDGPEFPPTPPIRLDRVSPGTPTCTRISGFANIGKLKNAVPIGGEARIRRSTRAMTGESGSGYNRVLGYTVAQTTDSTATALGFGFMPTTVSAQVQQIPGPRSNGSNYGNFRADLYSDNGYDNDTYAYQKSYMRMLVPNASVNGVPLDLGTGCGTGRTLVDVTSFLGNRVLGFNGFDKAGTFTGKLEIPPFAGCGRDEDLSPLLTAATSGTSNHVRLYTADWCRPDLGACGDGEDREPITWTVSPGGDFTATARPFAMRSNRTGPDGQFAELRCEAASLRMKFTAGHWQSGFRLGTVNGAKFEDCTRSHGGGKVTITAGHLPWNTKVLAQPGNANFTFTGLVIKAVEKVGDAVCTMQFGAENVPGERNSLGFMLAEYDNETDSFNAFGTIQRRVDDCPVSLPGFETGARVTPTFVGGFATDPAQTITTP